MRTSLRATKFALWVVFISSTVALVLFFGLNSIFANLPPAEPDEPAAPATDALWIAVQPENGRLIATAVNFNATDWQFIGPSSLANCNSTMFEASGLESNGGNEVVLEPADYGRYYCFQALSDEGEYVHRSHYIADSGAMISVSRSLDDDGRAVLAASYHRNVISWQFAGPLASAETCAAAAFAVSPADGASVTVETPAEAESAVYYCFRAETSPGSWLYKPYRLTPQA